MIGDGECAEISPPALLSEAGLRSASSDQMFAAVLSIIFFCAGLVTASHHEMWRDEMQAWLLARDSPSVAELFRNLKYEGCSGFWHLCLMGLERVFRSPVSMQIFHLAISTCAVYLVARFSPFSRMQSALFAAGYYPLFEYTVICRNYALAMLLCVVICLLITRPERSLTAMVICLSLLCHTCVHGVILACILGGILLAEQVFERKRQPLSGVLRVLFAFALIAIGILSSIMQMKPPAESGFASQWFARFDEQRFVQVVGGVARSYVPIPVAIFVFWNSNFTDVCSDGLFIQASVSGWLLFGIGLLLRCHPKVLFFFLTSAAGLLAFSYVKHSGGMRHEGFLFLVFVMSVWMVKSTQPKNSSSPPVRQFNRALNRVITSLFAVQAAGGLIAVVLDYQYPFSGGKAVAKFIESQKLQQVPIVCEPDYCGSSLLGLLHDAKATFLRGHRSGSFVVWDTIRLDECDNAHALADDVIIARSFSVADDVLLLLNRPLGGDCAGVHQVEVLMKCEPTIVADEQFYLYRLRK